MDPYTYLKAIFKNSRKAVSLALITAFIGSSLYVPQARAGEMVMPLMPIPGTMVKLSSAFIPSHLKGITIHPDNALQFDFLIHKGEGGLDTDQKQEEYNKLVKYFLASLTIPDEDQWVNLSPYEKGRVVQTNFGKTEMGRDLLSQDYFLKQITSSLMYPESGLGKAFWDKVYARAAREFGNVNIPVNTFNKVWIVPDEAVVYESGNTAYILKSHLKVMLEEDYLSLDKHSVAATAGADPKANAMHSVSSKVVREIILPELEKEVNEGKNFSMLRQIFSGMILATWYKHALKESLLGKIYADQAKVKGVDQDPKANEEIYQKYLAAFKKGVYNYIKEDLDPATNQLIPRKYFAGGFVNKLPQVERIITAQTMTGGDAAMLSGAIKRAVQDLTTGIYDRTGVDLRPSKEGPTAERVTEAAAKAHGVFAKWLAGHQDILSDRPEIREMANAPYNQLSAGWKRFYTSLARDALTELMNSGENIVMVQHALEGNIAAPAVTVVVLNANNKISNKVFIDTLKVQDRDQSLSLGMLKAMADTLNITDYAMTARTELPYQKSKNGEPRKILPPVDMNVDFEALYADIRQRYLNEALAVINTSKRLPDALISVDDARPVYAALVDLQKSQTPVTELVLYNAIEQAFFTQPSTVRPASTRRFTPSGVDRTGRVASRGIADQAMMTSDQMKDYQVQIEGDLTAFRAVVAQRIASLQKIIDIVQALKPGQDTSAARTEIMSNFQEVNVWINDRMNLFQGEEKIKNPDRMRAAEDVLAFTVAKRYFTNEAGEKIKTFADLPNALNPVMGYLEMGMVDKVKGFMGEQEGQVGWFISLFKKLTAKDVTPETLEGWLRVVQDQGGRPNAVIYDIEAVMRGGDQAMLSARETSAGQYEEVKLEKGQRAQVFYRGPIIAQLSEDVTLTIVANGADGTYTMSDTTGKSQQLTEGQVLALGDDYPTKFPGMTRANGISGTHLRIEAGQGGKFTFYDGAEGGASTNGTVLRFPSVDNAMTVAGIKSAAEWLAILGLFVLPATMVYFPGVYGIDGNYQVRVEAADADRNLSRINIERLRQPSGGFQEIIRVDDRIVRVTFEDGSVVRTRGAVINGQGAEVQVISIEKASDGTFRFTLDSGDVLAGLKDLKDKGFKLVDQAAPVLKVTANDVKRDDVGGIDLNAANLNLQIKRDGRGVPLPLPQQDMQLLNRIEGFVPVIIEIKPVTTLPILTELQQKIQTAQPGTMASAS